MNELINTKLISDSAISSKDAAFELIANLMVESGKVNNPNDVINGLIKREVEMTTGLGEGIAIPHGSIQGLKEPWIVILRSETPVEWESLDNKPVTLIISILVPLKEKSREDHFEILATLSSQLANKQVIEKIKTASKEELANFINDVANNKITIEEKIKTVSNKVNPGLKVVGVTTCATGVAHTFIAAKALEKEGIKRGWDIHVERQGQMTKNPLTSKQIEEADYVIIAKSKGIDYPERFDGKMVYETTVAEPITKASKSFDDMLAKASIQGKGLKKNINKSETITKEKTKKTLATGPMRHLLTGISYMIPFIAMAGITLGFTTAFGFSAVYSFFGGEITEAQYGILGQMKIDSNNIWWSGENETASQIIYFFLTDSTYKIDGVFGLGISEDIINPIIEQIKPNTDSLYMDIATYLGIKDGSDISLVTMGGATVFAPKGGVANAFNMLAGQAFTLYIPILGGYIAYSIAGRQAIAPAMILSLTMNITPSLTTGDSLLFVLTVGETGSAEVLGGWSVFFNWATLSFNSFDHPTALGFLGAVAVGYAVGYGTNYFTKFTDHFEHQAIQSMVPILIIPIVITIVFYLAFAFFIYLPIYWFAVGMGALVTTLIEHNMLWIAGLLMGAMICFDLGGPINKIAMATGTIFIGTHPEINGICGVAVSIPPMVLLVSLLFSKFTPLKMDENDKTAAGTAAVMGFFGITEGSIPFAAKDPKKWIPSFVIAGAVGGAIVVSLNVGNNVAMWGGPIIYIAGGYGNATDVETIGFMATNYAYAALYFIPLIIAAFTGFTVASLLEFVYAKLETKDKKHAKAEERKEVVVKSEQVALKMKANN